MKLRFSFVPEADLPKLAIATRCGSPVTPAAADLTPKSTFIRRRPNYPLSSTASMTHKLVYLIQARPFAA